MDAAEYKHIVLGLIFLKYVSEAFEAKHAELEADRKSGADPEDQDEYRAGSIFWGLDGVRVRVLDTLRRVRNVSDYTGEEIAESSVKDCIAEGERLHGDVMQWLRANRPKLVKPSK